MLPRVEAAVSGMKQPKHVVLTLPNYPRGKLLVMWKDLYAAFVRLKRSRLWDCVQGGIVARGLTFEPIKKTWHGHLHLLIDSDYIPKDDLKRAWAKATGRNRPMCSIDAVDSYRGAAWEIVKGTRGDFANLKTAWEKDFTLFDELVVAMNDMNRVWAFGDVKLPKKTKEKAYCPGCGDPVRGRDFRHSELTQGDYSRIVEFERWDVYFRFLNADDAEKLRERLNPKREVVKPKRVLDDNGILLFDYPRRI
jgi:hypothetical protein